jgi:integrase
MAERRRVDKVSALGSAVADYLSVRRSLGFKLERPGRLLPQFVSFCEAVGSDHVTVALAVSWATLPDGASPGWVAARLSMVRDFARHLALFDERTEIPPAGLLPGQRHRPTPYLYSEAEVFALMAAAERVTAAPFRQTTLRCIVGLLYVSGMRIGEVLRLDREDLDLEQGSVSVYNSKFGKSRELPLHASTVAALDSYAYLRDQRHPRSAAFFVSLAGTRLAYDSFHRGFQRLVHAAGIEPRSASCRPRPHGLRHSFAVSTLTRWYRESNDVEPRLAHLSTYLGHVHPAHTYWYLSAAPELLDLAAARLEVAGGGPG